MNLIGWLGTLAGICTTVAFVPQVWLVLKTGNTSGLSLGMYSIFTLGVFLWFVYGIVVGAPPIIYANGITFVLAATVLYKVAATREVKQTKT